VVCVELVQSVLEKLLGSDQGRSLWLGYGVDLALQLGDLGLDLSGCGGGDPFDLSPSDFDV